MVISLWLANLQVHAGRFRATPRARIKKMISKGFIRKRSEYTGAGPFPVETTRLDETSASTPGSRRDPSSFAISKPISLP
jgi:hypothetical protein